MSKTLITKIKESIENAIFMNEQGYYQDLYRTKVIHSQLGDNIHISFRFTTKLNNAFILSLNINTRENPFTIYKWGREEEVYINPASVILNISLLDETHFIKRWFSKNIYHVKKELKPEDTFKTLIQDKECIDFYQRHRYFPYTFLFRLYKDYIEKDIEEIIQVLEKEKVE